MIQLIAAGIGAVGQIAAGQAQKQASELNAFQIETDKEMNKVQALQASRARREEYDLATSANLAAFAAQGRDIDADRSVERFLREQKKLVAQDVGRIDQQAQLENSRLTLAAMTERRRGRNALYSSLFSAVGTVGEGYYKYKTIEV